MRFEHAVRIALAERSWQGMQGGHKKGLPVPANHVMLPAVSDHFRGNGDEKVEIPARSGNQRRHGNQLLRLRRNLSLFKG